MSAPPPITNADTALDMTFFAANPQRMCYARLVEDDWVLIVKRLVHKREPPIMLRVWARAAAIPDNDPACLKLWDEFAWERQ